MGLVFQCDYWSQWIWQVQYPGRDLLCFGYHQHVSSAFQSSSRFLTRPDAPQMRAANQQDLIYKRGQAGVTKASVTIVFDNSDRSKSPLGLEEYKQVTVTRQVCTSLLVTFVSIDIHSDRPSQRLQISTQWPQSPSGEYTEHVPIRAAEH